MKNDINKNRILRYTITILLSLTRKFKFLPDKIKTSIV